MSEHEAGPIGRPEDHFYAPVLARPGERQCPDCGGSLARRTSRKQGLLCTEVWYQCNFILCAATFKGFDEIVYRLKVPEPTNPLIKLPVSPSQRHATPLPAGLKRRSRDPRDGCPDCGEPLWKQMVPTDDPLVFVVYAECSSGACKWAASAPVELKPTTKSKPV